ncbi:hypothetical protein [Amycolatopsis sp. H20-H5]|uniref:hypothetical protein n=1 Tax=Amycolatopsis sp. H20-H5 TaxID=3046309 RepID=UPI002DB981E9|nr:hypothetical protein [Amycolatopsis sp. H20-H5]MEC3976013.1 hypothetical protein [Amycolatopsis sp. H20-H5]
MSFRLLCTFAAGTTLLLAGCNETTSGSAQPAVTSAPASSSAAVPTSAAATTSSSPASTSPPASSKPAADTPAAHSKAGAAEVATALLHAMGAKDLATTCRIVAPTFADEGGDKECRSRFDVLFSNLSAADLAEAKAAKVDPAKLKASGADKVTISGAAVSPPVRFFDQFGDLDLEWRGGTWLVTTG